MDNLQKRVTIGMPAGLGDMHWVMTKMESFKKINKIDHLTISVFEDCCHTNSKEFLELLPFVDESAVLKEYPSFDFCKATKLRKTIKKKSDPSIDYLIEFNTQLEAGNRIENILPEYDTNFDYPILEDEEAKIFAKKIREEIGEKLVLVYTSNFGMFDAWTKNTWFPEDWLKLIERIHASTGCKVVLVGKEWDKDYTSTIKKHDKNNIILNLTTKTNVKQILALIREADLFIGFPSGLTILSTKFHTPTVMFWSIKNITPEGQFNKEFQTCWVDPAVLNKNIYFPFAYGHATTTPDNVFRTIAKFLTIREPVATHSINCVEMFSLCKHIEGDVAECGVGSGLTTFPLDAIALQEGKNLFAFDTFTGLPYDDTLESDEPCKKGEMAYCGNEFFDALKTLDNTSIVTEKGLIENTLSKHIDRKFCFVWLDLDLYLSTLFAYKFFEDRMTKGGIIGFHDYNFHRCPGIKKVVDEEVNFDKYALVKDIDTCYFIRRI